MENNELNIIKHEGTIVFAEKNNIKVKVLSLSSCANCHAKGYCTSNDSKEKIIDIEVSKNSYKEGDKVMLTLSKKLGFFALFLAYILPLILMISSMLLLSIFDISEIYVGLISLLVLLPYYSIVYLFKDKLKDKFLFKIDLL